MFLELFDFELFFFQIFIFSIKMLVSNFMRFRRKRFEKQTHIDNFSLKKNPKQIYLASSYLLMP